MTALDKFDRLESGGLWREGQTASPREVTVSFGKSTLVLATGAGKALAHWSLPAVGRRNPGTRPAIYAPDDTATETLEIADPLMIDAIEQVRTALRQPTARPGRLRGTLTLAALAAMAIAAAVWAPPVLTERLLSVVHDAQRSEIGIGIRAAYEDQTRPACRGAMGQTALDQLHNRLMGPGAGGSLTIVSDLPHGAVALPGGHVLIDRSLVETHDDPAIVAGYILAAQAQAATHDPMAHVLDGAGFGAVVALYTTGDVGPRTLADHAAALRQSPPAPPSNDTLRRAFLQAQIPATPYLHLTAADAATQAALADAPDIASPALLDDRDWIMLQNICGETG